MPDPKFPRSAQLTYKDAGVDIDAGNEAVRRIRRLVDSTKIPEQVSDLGGFAGIMGLPSGLHEPLLVACTDGVGTKLMIAFALDRHDTVGIDLVAMNVNDLLVTGARPLFVLDYIACDKVIPSKIESIVAGIVEGCKQARCALLGGETAELPGLYAPGHYDLAASAVGVVERQRVLGPQRVRIGDRVLALPSSGLHSNGYTLARKVLLEAQHGGLGLHDCLPGHPESTVGAALLTPTRIYENAFAALRELPGAPLHGAAHITGGGLVENPARAIADDAMVELDLGDVPLPPVMQVIAELGVSRQEMLRTFNCGVGMLLYVDADAVAMVRDALASAGELGIEVGRVVPRDPSSANRVHLVER